EQRYRMRLFGQSKQPSSAPQEDQPGGTSPWADKYGRLTTRCVQTLALLALAAVGLFLIVQLRLILVPVIIALILASALNPITRRFRAWNFPMALAAAIMMVSIFGAFALIGWLVSWTVINQWEDLADS